MKDSDDFDVIIIGGSYAGLSAAMALGRSLRHVLIIDSGLPCNKQTPHSHNFITHDGEKPGVISKKAKEQVLTYSTVQFVSDLAVSSQKTKNGFTITTKSNGSFQAKKLILASGITDIMPDIPGFVECWGISIVHCPYCHGYELQGQNTAILANGERAFHLTSLVNNLTDRLTILTSGKAEFNAEQLVKLKQHGINIVETKIAEIEHQNGQLEQIIFENGHKLVFTAAYAAIPFVQHSDIAVSIGCELTQQGHINVDNFQRTTIASVYACGDCTSPMRSVANAVANGNLAGALINKELTDEQF